MKEFKVFFSWQSDLPSNQTKRFIEDSLEMAKDMLSETIDLVPDEATRERFGTPDVMRSIFDKIDECDLFIADVSIVGKYIPAKSSDENNPPTKHFSNPNVLLELGYAAANKTWDRCICFANTNYGGISDLPFDLNHRRITAFSYGEGGRKAELTRTANIIISTVQEYIDKPLPKKGFSLHLVGGYNFERRTIEQCIIPYNQYTFSQYNDHSQTILNEIKDIIDNISEIHLPPRSNSEIDLDFDTVTENMTYGEVMKDPVLAKEFSLRLMDLQDVKVDRLFIEKQIKQYWDFELCDDFCDLGGLQKSSWLLPHSSPSLEGSEQEKKKYNLLTELEVKLADIGIRNMFSHMFDNVSIIPLAIKNISKRSDERITVNIKVVEGAPIQPIATFFNQEFTGLEGSVYDDHLIKELLQLPENADISYDKSYPMETVEPYIPKFNMPMIDAFGYTSKPASNADDYEQELQDYVQELNDGTCDEYCFTIGALRPNETVWLDKVMLIQPYDGRIMLNYSIKSNNSTGELSGQLLFRA